MHVWEGKREREREGGKERERERWENGGSFNDLTPILTHTIHTCRWFFGRIKRADAEKKLLQIGNQSGTYLIRESESMPGQYSLSVRDADSVKHYRIRKVDTGQSVI